MKRKSKCSAEKRQQMSPSTILLVFNKQYLKQLMLDMLSIEFRSFLVLSYLKLTVFENTFNVHNIENQNNFAVCDSILTNKQTIESDL